MGNIPGICQFCVIHWHFLAFPGIQWGHFGHFTYTRHIPTFTDHSVCHCTRWNRSWWWYGDFLFVFAPLSFHLLTFCCHWFYQGTIEHTSRTFQKTTFGILWMTVQLRQYTFIKENTSIISLVLRCFYIPDVPVIQKMIVEKKMS